MGSRLAHVQQVRLLSYRDRKKWEAAAAAASNYNFDIWGIFLLWRLFHTSSACSVITPLFYQAPKGAPIFISKQFLAFQLDSLRIKSLALQGQGHECCAFSCVQRSIHHASAALSCLLQWPNIFHPVYKVLLEVSLQGKVSVTRTERPPALAMEASKRDWKCAKPLKVPYFFLLFHTRPLLLL